MYPTPTLWFEMGVAILLGLVFLWTKVEYGLFLYALALGFPDLAYPLGTTVNLRLEDVLIVLFLARAIFWTPLSPSRSQKKIFTWQGLFVAACLLSIAVESAQGTPPSGYDAARMAGCAVILGVLPLLLHSKRRLRFFIAGLMCGGVALAIQVHQHLGEIPSNGLANFQQLKSAANFGTWNPNTIGLAALLLVFAAGLGGIIFSKTPANRILWPCLAMGFALVPALLFVRGTSISIAAGFLLFLCLVRRWKWVLVFAVGCLCAIMYLHSRDPQLMEDAATVNLTTGEGFSHRFERWDMAFRAIQKDPFLGQGFGQELGYLTLIGSEGRAHNAYLSVWLEMGLGGLLLFLAAIFQFVRAGFSLYGNPRFQFQGALILALIFALSLDSLGFATLYWEKPPAIALSLAIALVGICERNELEFAARENRMAAREPSAQLT
jgi:O-antigen ligase